MQTEAQTGGATAAAIPQTAYDRVQALRIERGWSESEACRQAGVARNLLAQKRDRKTLSDESLAAFAKAYGVQVEDLTRGTVAAPKPGALPIAIPGAASIDPASTRVPWHRLVASTFNPRRTFDEALLAELADSIATSGLLQNLVVRELPGDGAPLTIADGEGNRVRMLEVIAGERRYRAIGILVKDGRWNPDEANVAVRILDAGDGDALAVALLENLQREDVPEIEEAEAFARLQDIDPATWTPAAIAARIHKSERHVQGRISLARKLTEEVKEILRAGKINVSQARAISMAKPKQQVTLANEAVGNSWLTEDRIRGKLTQNLPHVKHALFDLSAYDGEIYEPEEPNGPRLFADRKLFDKLQKPFIDAKVERLSKKWAFVDVRKGWPRSWDYPDAKKGDKKAGAVLWVELSGKITTVTGVTKRPELQSHDYEAERRRDEQARKDRTASLVGLRRELLPKLAEDVRLGLILTVVDMLDDHCDEDLRDPQLAVWRKHARKGGFVLFDALDALDATTLAGLISRLAAEQLDIGNIYSGDMEPGACWLADRFSHKTPQGWKVPRGMKRDGKGSAAVKKVEGEDADPPFTDTPEERACRVCGCTEDHACEGGCSWVEEDLCSACAGKGGEA